MKKSILIVEDDVTYGLMLKTWLEKKGFAVTAESSVARAQKYLSAHHVDLILSDLRLPDTDGITLLEWIKSKKPEIPFIMMTSYADVQSAVHTIKMGANDYVTKPIIPDELLKKIDEAWKAAKENAPKEAAAKVIHANNQNTKTHIEGTSDASRALYNYVRLVAPTNMSVLINGASGTGKEYVAHRIHELSQRSDKPFVAIDCGAIPKELAASEFFGHVKGSFTGALTDKTGAFVAANGGTVFLDEIGNLGYEIQVQLLRALQERKIRPIGSNKEVDVDIRLISATNENLEKAIENGMFREDLFHRLNEFTLKMPLLKGEKEDIMLFANFFLDQANKELQKKVIGFDSKASKALTDYHWPGNLRQMKNIIRRATLLAAHDFITCTELGEEVTMPQVTESANADMALRNDEVEKSRILKALQQAENNKSKAAKLLNIDRKTLYNKMKQHHIDL